MLGGTHPKARIELHDVVFAWGGRLDEIHPELRAQWFGAPRGVHVDSWMEVDGIDGWQALMVWTAAQVPFIAWSVDGNPTTQVVDILLGFSSTISVNGVVTSSEQYGLNAVGIVLAIWASRSRDRWDRKLTHLVDQPAAAATGAA